MALWKKAGCVAGGVAAAVGSVVAAPFVATTAPAIAAAVVVGGTIGAVASTFFGSTKLVFLMQGEGGSGKTTIVEKIIGQSSSIKKTISEETTTASRDPKNYVRVGNMGFIDVAANDLGIRKEFVNFPKRVKKAILYVFDAQRYKKGDLDILENEKKYYKEIQTAIKYFQFFCEEHKLLLFIIGTHEDQLSQEEVSAIEKEVLGLSSDNSSKSKVVVQIIDAREQDKTHEVIKRFCNQAIGGDF